MAPLCLCEELYGCIIHGCDEFMCDACMLVRFESLCDARDEYGGVGRLHQIGMIEVDMHGQWEHVRVGFLGLIEEDRGEMRWQTRWILHVIRRGRCTLCISRLAFALILII